MADFANILFSGACNARCGFCIGGQISADLQPANLDEYPPRGLGAWLRRIRETGTRQVVLTGTNTDPQLYRHEARLLDSLRQNLPAGSQIALHTNGRLAMKKMAELEMYDRVCISIPAYDAELYEAVMGVPGPIDVEGIVAHSRVPVKLSCVVVPANRAHIKGYLESSRKIGIQRVVLRKLAGNHLSWNTWLGDLLHCLQPDGEHSGCPVYRYEGMQVTLWDFSAAQCSSINLFSSGVVSEQYQLAQAGEKPAEPVFGMMNSGSLDQPFRAARF